jgi:hypothetical protein
LAPSFRSLYTFKSELDYAHRTKFPTAGEVKTIQTLNLLIPHVFPVLIPLEAALERSKIHALLQIIMNPKESHGLRLSLIISRLADDD